MRFLFSALVCSLFPLAAYAGGISYSVEFEGLDDAKALKALQSASQLTSLKKRPPVSINALRYRADSDIPEMLKVLHAYGYYEAKINVVIQEIFERVQVVVLITPGPLYHIENYEILLYCSDPDEPNTCCSIPLGTIGIRVGKPARAERILSAELKALHSLSECGYPLAEVEDRKIVVDGETKGMSVTVSIKTGEKASFGPTTIVGAEKVRPLFIEQKLNWCEQETYNSEYVDHTQNTLIDTGLFSSVLITHEETLSSNGELPMKVEVSEAKHKTINIGLSYQTVFGPGITFGWENRNVGGMGRKLSFQGDVTRISQTGVATYLHPNFQRINQDLISQAQAMHENLFAYSMRSYGVFSRLDRKLGKGMRAAIGVQGARLYVTESVQNGNYWLLSLPLYLRWSSANSLLNPTRGAILEITATPAVNIGDAKQYYLVGQFSESSYHALDEKAKIVLAQKLTLGSIFSDGLRAVPLCNRYLGGSEQELRGYRYRTVSPLEEGKPLGGRSAIYFTFETRFRVSKEIGLVPFFDIGNVQLTQYPTIHGKWFKSTGLGLRYFSFMGPFRLDAAFPLNRRKGIDPVYKILVSIGQTF